MKETKKDSQISSQVPLPKTAAEVPGPVAAEMIQLKRIASYKAGGYYE
jgi:hypothetical protein